MNVLHNAHLEDIVRLMPRSSNGLQKISGIGKAKSEQYGQEILTILHNTPANELIVLDGNIQLKPSKEDGNE